MCPSSYSCFRVALQKSQVMTSFFPPMFFPGAATGSKPASLLVVPLEKALNGIPHLSVVDRWPATTKRARTAHGRFLVIGG